MGQCAQQTQLGEEALGSGPGSGATLDQLLPFSGSLFCFCTKTELQSVISETMRLPETLQQLYNQGDDLGALESN